MKNKTKKTKSNIIGFAWNISLRCTHIGEDHAIVWQSRLPFAYKWRNPMPLIWFKHRRKTLKMKQKDEAATDFIKDYQRAAKNERKKEKIHVLSVEFDAMRASNFSFAFIVFACVLHDDREKKANNHSSSIYSLHWPVISRELSAASLTSFIHKSTYTFLFLFYIKWNVLYAQKCTRNRNEKEEAFEIPFS